MNHQFTGTRSPTQNSSMPFYNPQKDVINPNNPILYQNNNPTAPGFIPGNNSKSYIARSNILEQPKPSNNTSAYLKNNTEGPPPISKFLPNGINSPNGTSNYPLSFQSKTQSSEMVKSTIQEGPKIPQNNFGYPIQPPQKPAFLSNTPTRRAPRMSEPHQFDNNPVVITKPFDLKPNNDQLNESPLQKRFKDPKQFQNNFFKNKIGDKQKQEKVGLKFEPNPKFEVLNTTNSSLGKSEIWNKTSTGLTPKKKAPCVADFRKIKELGSGKYGQVSLVQQKNTGFVCALKMIQKKLLKEQDITQQFIRQLKIQMFLNHPNIIRMYGFFDDQSYIYIILECGTGGQLYHQLKKTQPMAQNKVAPIMKQVCDAINEIHTQRIIHRDIKPENIVIHDNVIKLCDFGWSVYVENKLRTTFCGTPLYVCPQILKGKQYDQKIDIWSLGIMMYEMLVGENPFKITKEEELIKIVKEEISIPSYVFVSRQGRDFLDKCLKKNPADRVHIKQLLNHQFFVKNMQKDKKVAF